jgi:Ca2+-binding RTX toxin-like protein
MGMFEILEGRKLFSVALVGTQIQVTGTADNDVVRIEQFDASTLRVEENGVVQFFADGSVSSILMNGGDGNDTLVVSSTPAAVLDEPATINGGVGNDVIRGGSGADVLNGDAGDDDIRGSQGNDSLNGGTGNNQLFGETGDDTMTAGLGADVFSGSFGVDTVTYATRTASLSVRLNGFADDGELITEGTSLGLVQRSEGDDVRDSVENVITGSGNDLIQAGTLVVHNTFDGGSGNDRLEGGGGNDTLLGQAGDDVLLGRAGNDALRGSFGNDQLLGGAGDDDVRGGDGNDVLTGGAGIDRLRGENGNDFLIASDGSADTLVDGGSGQDIADVDSIDAVPISIEILA